MYFASSSSIMHAGGSSTATLRAQYLVILDIPVQQKYRQLSNRHADKKEEGIED